MGNELLNVIKSSPLIVHKGRYAYLKGNENELKNHFFISQDNDEITIVTKEENIESTKYEKDVKWFKLLEIKISTPFETVGFFAKITNTIASKGLNILILSTFSKDYILVREEKYTIAINALKELGFPIEMEK